MKSEIKHADFDYDYTIPTYHEPMEEELEEYYSTVSSPVPTNFKPIPIAELITSSSNFSDSEN